MMDKPATEKPYITLVCNPYEHETSVNTRITIDVMQKDLSRTEIVEVLESFIKAMGYSMDSDEVLDIVRI